MGLFEFIIAITGIGTLAGIIQSGMQLERQRIKAKSRSGEAAEQSGVIAEMHAEIVKLRDRVNVLEKLATDDDRKLASEIERLRGENRPNY